MSALVNSPSFAPLVTLDSAVYLTESYSLDLLHTIWLLSLDDKLHLAPLSKPAPRVLDIGCGTGIWSIEFGSVSL